ncbi:hypothetical protein ABPG75_005692 [Micractinium tetrahymenae]
MAAAAAATGGAAAGGAAAGGVNSPTAQTRASMHDLTLEGAQDAAVALSSLNLSDKANAEAVAAQVYEAAIGGKAEAVAGALAALVALERGGGNARLLRRLVLTHCEKVFDLAPPPGNSLAAKMGVMEFVAALLRAGVVPASIVHTCLIDLLAVSKPGASSHDLECAAVLLSGAGRQLDRLSADSRRAMDGYIAATQAAVDAGGCRAAGGKLEDQPLLAAKLRSVCALRAAGWEPPHSQHPAQAPALLPGGAAPAPPAAHSAGAAAAAGALGRQLSLRGTPLCSTTPANSPAGVALPAAPAQQASQLQQGLPAGAAGAPTAAFSPRAGRPAYRPLGQPQAPPPPGASAVPAAPSAQPQPAPPSLQDRFTYLDPIDGSREHGPCLLEHLLGWCQRGSLPAHTKVRLEGSSAWLDLALVQHCVSAGAPLPPALPPGASLRLQERFLYLDPEGSGREHGPCSLEQLLFWSQQGHLTADTKVRHTSSPAWLDLGAVQNSLGTGMPPAAPAPAMVAPGPRAPQQQLPPPQQPRAPPAQAGWAANGQGLAGASSGNGGSSIWGPPSTAPAATPSNGSSGAGSNGWQGWAAPGSQHPHNIQQHSQPKQAGAPMRAPAVAAPPGWSSLPTSFGPDGQPPPATAGQQASAQRPQVPASKAGPDPSPSAQPQKQQKPAQQVQQAQQKRPGPCPTSSATSTAGQLLGGSWADAEEAEEDPDAAWETVLARKPAGGAAHSAAVPAPMPLAARMPAAQRSSSGSFGSPAGHVSPALAGGKGGRKKKSPEGYEDDQVWMLRSARGKVTGPFSGHQLHDMLHRDEVPQDSLCKQGGWKAWKPIEEVEGMVLEMYSRKPNGQAKGQQAQQAQQAQQMGRRHSSDLENAAGRSGGAGSGAGKGCGGGGGRGGGWQQRAVASIVQQTAAGSSSAAQQATRPAEGLPPASPPAAAGTPARPAANAPASPLGGLATPQQQESSGGATPGGAGDPPAAGTPASPAYSLGTPSWCPAGAAGLLGGFTPSPVPKGDGQGLPLGDAPAGGGSPAGSSKAGGVRSPPGLTRLAGAAGGPQVSAEVKPAFAAWSAAEAKGRKRGCKKKK